MFRNRKEHGDKSAFLPILNKKERDFKKLIDKRGNLYYNRFTKIKKEGANHA